MTAGLLLIAAALGAPTASTDTIVELRRGDRVVIENLSGEIDVRTWDRDDLEVSGDERRWGLALRRSGSRVIVTRDGPKGRRGRTHVQVRLPEWVDLEIGGLSLDVSVRGLAGRVDVRNVSGDVLVEGTRGDVVVRTVSGEIDVLDAHGRISVSSQGDEVRLRGVRGQVEVHSGSGDITLEDIDAESVRAETQDGDIDFSGRIADGGSYGFFLHDGDATIAVQRSVNALVSISTFDGDFESEFPVLIQRFTGGREFDFTLGDGAARLEIQVFDGEIRLLQRR